MVIIGFYGESKTTELLVASQVVLSMQLGFAVWPLMRFTGEKAKMGNSPIRSGSRSSAGPRRFIIIVLNVKLLFDTFMPEAARRRFLRLPWPARRIISPCITRFSFRSKTVAADQAILDHIKPLAKMTGARLLLMHVADGWVARNYDRLNLAESEEMRKDRAYLETALPNCAAKDSPSIICWHWANRRMK